MFFFLLVYILICFGIGALAENRKIGFWPAFFLSFLCTPIVGILAAVLSSEDYKTSGSTFETWVSVAQQQEFQGNKDQAIIYYKNALLILINHADECPRSLRGKKANKVKRTELRNKIVMLGGEVPKLYYELTKDK